MFSSLAHFTSFYHGEQKIKVITNHKYLTKVDHHMMEDHRTLATQIKTMTLDQRLWVRWPTGFVMITQLPLAQRLYAALNILS